MNSKVWFSRALSLCLIVVTFTAYSMVTPAMSDKIAGELVFAGNGKVLVNGEIANNGRTIFSSSTIATPENSSAIINMGDLGSVKLAPNSTITLVFDEKGISGDLLSGQVSVLSAKNAVNIITMEGTLNRLEAGESASTRAAQDDDDDDDAGAGAWFVWALVLGGAAAGLILASTSGNDIELGGGATVVSPNN